MLFYLRKVISIISRKISSSQLKEESSFSLKKLIVDDNPYQIPNTDPSVTTIPSKGYLVIWCDDDQEQGPLHVSKKLKKSGESIILLSSDKTTVIDSYTYSEQTTDISMGRDPNNVNNWIFFDNPTPGFKN